MDVRHLTLAILVNFTARDGQHPVHVASFRSILMWPQVTAAASERLSRQSRMSAMRARSKAARILVRSATLLHGARSRGLDHLEATPGDPGHALRSHAVLPAISPQVSPHHLPVHLFFEVLKLEGLP